MSRKDEPSPGRFRVDRADLPLGIERVIYMAATDPEFAQDLLSRRIQALAHRRVVLRPSEIALLQAIPSQQLRANIQAVDITPPNVQRRTFLRAAALTSATAMTGKVALGGCEREAGASPLRSLAAQHAGGPLDPGGTTGFYMEVKDRGLIQRLSLFVEVEADSPRSLEVALTTPSGADIAILDGEHSAGVTARGVRGWYGSDGHPTVESLAALADSPARGQWQLTVRNLGQGALLRWRMAGHVSDESLGGTYSTFTQYAITQTGGGCDCG